MMVNLVRNVRTNSARMSKKVLAVKLAKVEERHKDHKYLENIRKRVMHENNYHHINIKRFNHIVCAYCGFPATGYDHIPPLSKYEEYVAIRVNANLKVKALKVSCCHECNTLLGPTLTTSIVTRFELIRERIKRKYAGKVAPDDKLTLGRLARRLNFNQGFRRLVKYDD